MALGKAIGTMFKPHAKSHRTAVKLAGSGGKSDSDQQVESPLPRGARVSGGGGQEVQSLYKPLGPSLEMAERYVWLVRPKISGTQMTGFS